ncbi:conserved protein of unknown function (plasmid) [Magnetospirillum sp. XM-1]|nr:conserved protein of unknown function [Magnetospirillum sp. XM-1]
MLFAVQLEADSDALDHHRIYRMEVERDLLGDVIVIIAHGRRGSRLAARSIHVPDLSAAQEFVRSRLRRRATAPRRIGCSYRITALDTLDDPTPYLLDPAAQRRMEQE